MDEEVERKVLEINESDQQHHMLTQVGRLLLWLNFCANFFLQHFRLFSVFPPPPKFLKITFLKNIRLS